MNLKLGDYIIIKGYRKDDSRESFFSDKHFNYLLNKPTRVSFITYNGDIYVSHPYFDLVPLTSDILFDKVEDSEELPSHKIYKEKINEFEKLIGGIKISSPKLYLEYLKESVEKVLKEEKLYITPQELIKNLPKELKELLFKQWGAKQNPEWHPEGNTLKHILVVLKRAYHHYPDDPNMVMAALFHDLGKMDTYNINPKTNQPTAYGHEFKSSDYVERFRDWVESFDGTDVDEIKYLVQNHMKVKPRTWDSMRDIKKEPIKSHPAFNKLMGFTDKLDGGGTDLKESIRRILREEYSPAGRKIIPNKIVVHKSNPLFRDGILEEGLKVRVGECYQIYVNREQTNPNKIKCKPVIFATNSTKKRDWFDSTYDDDIWEINTEMIPDVKWYKDKHFDSRDKHIVTFQDIPKEAITLIYEGTGESEDNIQESIRRILREELNESNFLYTIKDSIGRLLLRDKYNFKPSLSFDKKFGTNISQKYDYPFGLNQNKIWRIIDSCNEGNEKNCVLVKKIVDKLGDYFPYPDYNNLPFEKKVDILQGMVSNFNYDDIISFSVEVKTGENNELEDEVNELQNKINYTIQWLPSKKTIEKIKNHMNLQESIRRILREELSPRVRRRVPYDEMEKEFLESFNNAYNLTKRRRVLLAHFLDELIITTITMMMDGFHWRFTSTFPEHMFWYDDIHTELENHYRDRITQMYNERQGINESILKEETEEYKVKLVTNIIYTLYDNISFIKQSTFNGKPLLIIYFDSDDTAANIESWFDEKISRDIDEWTSGNIVVCPSWIFNWDSRKKNADVFINTELIKYDNLGNVVNESILREETSSEQIKDIILNGTDFDDWIRAIKMKYGDIVSLYHATTKDNSKLIDKEGFKLVDGKNYKSFGKEPILYFQIGKSDYQAENRPVLYRLDVPIDFLYNADIDMDGPNISDETLFKYVDEETWDDLPYEIRDAIIYFIWNDFKLDGTEIFITDRFMDKPGEDIFKGLTPKKIKK